MTITGDTTSSLTYTVSLASGVSFQHPTGKQPATDNSLYFELTGGSSIVFRLYAHGRDRLHVWRARRRIVRSYRKFPGDV